MSMFAITSNGVTRVVEAPNKAAANAYAHAHTEITVEQATLAQIQAAGDLSAVPVVLKGGKTQAEVDAAAAAEAEKKAKKEAAKATA